MPDIFTITTENLVELERLMLNAIDQSASLDSMTFDHSDINELRALLLDASIGDDPSKLKVDSSMVAEFAALISDVSKSLQGEIKNA